MPRRFEPLVDGRESIRLDGFDYTRAGAYFVTCCIERRKRILGTVRCGVMHLSDAGHAVADAWQRLPAHYPHVQLDAFVVMPDHVHGIIVLVPDDGWDMVAGRSGASDDGHGTGQVGAGLRPAPAVPTLRPSPDAPGPPTRPRRHALPEIVRAFKSFSARAINQHQGTPGARVWQRNYFERIIWSQHQLEATRRYIRNNPAKWGDDRFH